MKLLVIDIQKGITDSRLFNFEAFIDDTTRIIKAARDNQIEVIYFQHDDGPGTGFSIGDEDFEIAEQVMPKDFFISYYTNAIIYIMKYWMKNNFKQTPKEIYDMSMVLLTNTIHTML